MQCIKIFILLGLIAWCCPASLLGAEAKPNLILMMADDLVYETIGADGRTSYKTPSLDMSAATGARLTH